MADLTAAALGRRVLAVTDQHAADLGKNADDCVCLGCLSRRVVLDALKPEPVPRCEDCQHVPHAGKCFVCGCPGWAVK